MKRKLFAASVEEAEEHIGPGFVGRTHELLWLREHLGREVRAVCVAGARGTGKSAICLAYAKKNASLYDVALWVHCDHFSSADALSSFVLTEAASRLRIDLSGVATSEDMRARFGNRRALVIVDDVQVQPEVVEHFCRTLESLPRGLQFIFSTHLIGPPSWLPEGLAHLPTLTLNSMSQSEVLDMLRERQMQQGLDSFAADRLLQQLQAFGLAKVSHSPELLLNLLSLWRKQGAFGAAVSEALETTTGHSANLVVVPQNDRLRVLPAWTGGISQVVSPSQPSYPAAPLIVVPSLKRVWRDQLAEFEELLNDPTNQERHFQQFFERNPHFLKGVDYNSVIPHPVLERDADGDLIPDFFLEPLNSSLVDILDLKTPTAKLVVRQKNRLRYSREVVAGVAQLREYRDYFEDPRCRDRVRARYGITSYRPNAILVIGRTPDGIPEEKLKQMSDTNAAYSKIMTYDELYLKMRRMVEVGSI